jgi:uncharacterized protein YbjT (DUF2867 family)
MYLVVGAAGNVGSEVVAQLLVAGEQVRVFTRDSSKVSNLKGPIKKKTTNLTPKENEDKDGDEETWVQPIC